MRDHTGFRSERPLQIILVQPLLKMVFAAAGCLGSHKAGFWAYPRIETHNLLSNLFQCSATLSIKKCFPMFRWNFLYISLCPLHPTTGYHWEDTQLFLNSSLSDTYLQAVIKCTHTCWNLFPPAWTPAPPPPPQCITVDIYWGEKQKLKN